MSSLFLLFIVTTAFVDVAVCFVSVAVVAASVTLLLLFLLLRLLLLFVIVVINIVIAFDDDDDNDDDTTIYYNNTKCVLIIQATCFSNEVFLYSMLTRFSNPTLCYGKIYSKKLPKLFLILTDIQVTFVIQRKIK